MSCDAASARARRQRAPDPQFDTKLLAKRFPLCARIYTDMALTEREHARITALLSHGMAWWSETEWLRGSQERVLARTKIREAMRWSVEAVLLPMALAQRGEARIVMPRPAGSDACDAPSG
jgi:hypothetical protein